MVSVYEKKTHRFYKNNKLVGVYLPIETVDHLTLLCMVINSTKTKILKDLINKHMEKEVPEVETLIEQISDAWIDAWKSNQISDENVFKISIVNELKDNKISKKHIDKILNIISYRIKSLIKENK